MWKTSEWLGGTCKEQKSPQIRTEARESQVRSEKMSHESASESPKFHLTVIKNPQNNPKHFFLFLFFLKHHIIYFEEKGSHSNDRSATEMGITHRTIQLLLADGTRRHHTKNQRAQPNCHISWSHSLSTASFWKRWDEKQTFPFPPPKQALKVMFKVRSW